MKKGPKGPITTHLSGTGGVLVGRRLHWLDPPRPGAGTDDASRPEAESEYSRGQQAPKRRFPPLGRGSAPGRQDGTSKAIRSALLVGGLAGSLLLLVAEFTPLFTIHTSSSQAALKTVQTGSHHSYALIPVAILAVLLTVEVWRTASRLALLRPACWGSCRC